MIKSSSKKTESDMNKGFIPRMLSKNDGKVDIMD